MKKTLNLVLGGSPATKRFHAVDTIKTQDIAAHSFGVAWLCEFLTGGLAPKSLIMAALAHDLAEAVTGDIPAPTKRELGIRDLVAKAEAEIMVKHGLGDYGILQANATRVLNLADALDGMAFCVRERALGNRLILATYRKFRGYVLAMDLGSGHPNEVRVFEIVNNAWEEYDGCK